MAVEPELPLTERRNPRSSALDHLPTGDILGLMNDEDATVARLGDKRPPLVIGFAAETANVVANAQAKLKRKGCDWILANDVSPDTGVFGGDSNTIHLVTAGGVESWSTQTKDEVAATLIARIAAKLSGAAA